MSHPETELHSSETVNVVPSVDHFSSSSSLPKFSFESGDSAGIDRLVRDYLLAKGYGTAASAMEKEIENRQEGKNGAGQQSAVDVLVNTTMAKTSGSQQKMDGINLVEAIYIKALHDNDFNLYVTELNDFSSWALGSLHIVKNYLLAVLFAMFCHCYVAMIRNGNVAPAQKLFSCYREYFNHSFGPELHRLALLHSADQLEDIEFLTNNSFVKSLLKDKFKVLMSPLALQLASQKLRQDNLVMLATIINQKVVFEKLEPVDPSIVESDDRESWSLISLPGYHSESLAEQETTKLVLGVAGMGDVAKFWKERSALFGDIEFPDVTHDHLLEVWTSKLIRPHGILKKCARMDGSIPDASNQHTLDQCIQRAGHAFSKLASTAASTIGNSNGDVFAAPSAAASSLNDDGYIPGKYGDTLNPSIICATISNAYDHLTSMDISPSVNQIATAHHDSIVRVWRVNQTPEEQSKFPWFGRNLPAPQEWEMNQILPVPENAHDEQQSQNGNRSVTGGSTVGSSRTANTASKPTGYPCLEFVGHSMPVYSVAQSPCERFVLSASADETIRAWDTAVVQCVGKYHCFSTPWHVRSSPIDAYYFAAGHADRTVSVYGMDREAPIRLMTGHTSDVNVVAWHGNGVLLASGSDDRSARLWDIRSAKSARIFHHCNAPITALQLSSLGTLLAAGTDEGKIYVWDIRTSRQLAILHGHNEEVTSLSFSQDRNQALCSGALDCSVRVWDLRVALETAYHSPTTQASASLPFDYSVCVLKATNAYFTKACPVYHVGYTDKGMVYCGGMYSAATASAIREKNVTENSTAVAEQMLIKSFGMSSVIPTKTVTSSML